MDTTRSAYPFGLAAITEASLARLVDASDGVLTIRHLDDATDPAADRYAQPWHLTAGEGDGALAVEGATLADAACLMADLLATGAQPGPSTTTVYLIGINKPSGVEIVGVFATEEAAVAECHTDEYFVSPQVMGVAQPYEPTTWNLGAWYPKLGGRRNTAWHCSACGQEGSLHVPPGTSALDSIPMVRHCHDHQSPDCRVDGSRRIRVRRLSGPADDGRDESVGRAEPVVVGGMA